jgi:hypothetical protein
MEKQFYKRLGLAQLSALFKKGLGETECVDWSKWDGRNIVLV